MPDWTGDYSDLHTQQSTVNVRVRGTSDASPQELESIRVQVLGQRGWSWPKHEVTEKIMMSAEDKRPEATLFIGLS